jgi:hypothetical protein
VRRSNKAVASGVSFQKTTCWCLDRQIFGQRNMASITQQMLRPSAGLRLGSRTSCRCNSLYSGMCWEVIPTRYHSPTALLARTSHSAHVVLLLLSLFACHGAKPH